MAKPDITANNGHDVYFISNLGLIRDNVIAIEMVYFASEVACAVQ